MNLQKRLYIYGRNYLSLEDRIKPQRLMRFSVGFVK